MPAAWLGFGSQRHSYETVYNEFQYVVDELGPEMWNEHCEGLCDSNMDEEQEDFELRWQALLVGTLDSLSPHEFALLVQEADILIRELPTLTAEELAQRQLTEDPLSVFMALVNEVLDQVGPAASENLINLQRQLNDEARFKRMMDEDR